jgi:hypothetical protein
VISVPVALDHACPQKKNNLILFIYNVSNNTMHKTLTSLLADIDVEFDRQFEARPVPDAFKNACEDIWNAQLASGARVWNAPKFRFHSVVLSGPFLLSLNISTYLTQKTSSSLS